MATLPSVAKILFEGFSEQRESALMRTEMESGPPRQVKTKSRIMIKRPISMLFSTKADYLSFLSWYSTDINEGADWFQMTDPVTGSTIDARFVAGTLSGQPVNPGMTRWTIKAQIEAWGV
jgi:hypothetical protein